MLISTFRVVNVACAGSSSCIHLHTLPLQSKYRPTKHSCVANWVDGHLVQSIVTSHPSAIFSCALGAGLQAQQSRRHPADTAQRSELPATCAKAVFLRYRHLGSGLLTVMVSRLSADTLVHDHINTITTSENIQGAPASCHHFEHCYGRHRRSVGRARPVNPA